MKNQEEEIEEVEETMEDHFATLDFKENILKGTIWQWHMKMMLL